MSFIRVTRFMDNKLVYVNSELVDILIPFETPEKEGTFICLASNTEVKVKESIMQIAQTLMTQPPVDPVTQKMIDDLAESTRISNERFKKWMEEHSAQSPVQRELVPPRKPGRDNKRDGRLQKFLRELTMGDSQ